MTAHDLVLHGARLLTGTDRPSSVGTVAGPEQARDEPSRGETTPDGRFTLKKVECLASCGTAPMLQVNEDRFLENLGEQDVDRILDALKHLGR